MSCGGVTTTLDTGSRCTVIVAMPDLPFTLAAISVDPADTPVTTPALEIEAMFGSRTDQNTLLPVIGLPEKS